MKKAAFLQANALARAVRSPALRSGGLLEQSSYQSARYASIITHSTIRISGNVHAAIVAHPPKLFGIRVLSCTDSSGAVGRHAMGWAGR